MIVISRNIKNKDFLGANSQTAQVNSCSSTTWGGEQVEEYKSDQMSLCLAFSLSKRPGQRCCAQQCRDGFATLSRSVIFDEEPLLQVTWASLSSSLKWLPLVRKVTLHKWYLGGGFYGFVGLLCHCSLAWLHLLVPSFPISPPQLQCLKVE